MLRILVMIAFPASVFAIPLSVVSLFSHEKLSKRIFALAVNLLPAGLIGYALMIEIMEEFFLEKHLKRILMEASLNKINHLPEIGFNFLNKQSPLFMKKRHSNMKCLFLIS